MSIRVGLGSWTDDAYAGVLYDPGSRREQRLRDYARRFDHVEVNSTYYATPSGKVVSRWVEQTPPGFSFSWKLPRAVAQAPGAAAGRELVDRLLAAAEPLLSAHRLATFFLLMPPRFAPARHRLEELEPLIASLRGHTVAVELRDCAWVTGKQREATFAFFRERMLVWVGVDMPRLSRSTLMPPVDEITNSTHAYLRLHGRSPSYLVARTAAERHHYLYSSRELSEIVARVRWLADRAREVYVIANNHAADFAPRTALALKDKLGLA